MSERTDTIYAYIIEHKAQHDGLAPTIRDICDVCAISSTSVAAYYLDKLQAQGKIRRCYGVPGIEVVGGKWLPPEGES